MDACDDDNKFDEGMFVDELLFADEEFAEAVVVVPSSTGMTTTLRPPPPPMGPQPPFSPNLDDDDNECEFAKRV